MTSSLNVGTLIIDANYLNHTWNVSNIANCVKVKYINNLFPTTDHNHIKNTQNAIVIIIMAKQSLFNN
jgi:hypothetical protein